MMNTIRIETVLKQAISSALQSLYGIAISPDEINLQETKKEFKGDLTLVVFPFTAASKKTPEVTASEIGNFIQQAGFPLRSFNVVKGFLNIEVTVEFWKNYLNTIDNDQGLLFDPLRNAGDTSTRQKLMVEYSSPNTNKPLHLGHVRNILLGHAVSEILKANGHEVIKVNLVNDRGIHICKSMLAWQKFGQEETPESSGMKGDKLVGKYYVLYDKKYKEQVEKLEKEGVSQQDAEKSAPILLEVQEMLRKWESGDKETLDLWKKMNGWVYNGFDETYASLGVSFDKTYYESQTYLLGKAIVEEGLTSGAFFKKADGSVWIDLKEAGLDEKVVLRADGTSVYITQDIGTANLRFTEFPGLEKLIYVVGNEQDYHFKVLKEIMKKLGRKWADGIFHLSYGMVDLPTGKMKSREGTVVDADDLIHEIVEEAEMATKAQGKLDDFNSAEAKKLYHDLGLGALKYFILKVDPKKKMLFNPAESIDLNGNTGPFIQYTHARIRSVLRKGKGYTSGNLSAHQPSEQELTLIKLIYNYPLVIKEAAQALAPSLVANYAYEVAKAYNHFYHDHIIVNEDETNTTFFRLRLSDLTSKVIRQSMFLLGIEVPERM